MAIFVSARDPSRDRGVADVASRAAERGEVCAGAAASREDGRLARPARQPHAVRLPPRRGAAHRGLCASAQAAEPRKPQRGGDCHRDDGGRFRLDGGARSFADERAQPERRQDAARCREGAVRRVCREAPRRSDRTHHVWRLRLLARAADGGPRGAAARAEGRGGAGDEFRCER